MTGRPSTTEGANLARIAAEGANGAIIDSSVYNANKGRCWTEMANVDVKMDTSSNREQAYVSLVEPAAKDVSTKTFAQIARHHSN